MIASYPCDSIFCGAKAGHLFASMEQIRLQRDDRHFADVADRPGCFSGYAPQQRRCLAEW
jgi:hypothetical protein